MTAPLPTPSKEGRQARFWRSNNGIRACLRYSRSTGFTETNINAVRHHRLSLNAQFAASVPNAAGAILRGLWIPKRRLTQEYVRTYTVRMNVTLSIEDEVIAEARRRAEALGTSVNQLVRDYLEQFAGKASTSGDAKEFERLSRLSNGDAKGWKFDRDEIHERR